MNRRGFFVALASVLQFLRDLALLPAILRRAAAAERYRRWSATSEGQEQERQDVIAVLDQLRRERSPSNPPRTASDGASA